MTTTDSSKEPETRMSDREGFVFWMLVVAGLFLNVTLTLGDSGRVLLLSVFDVVLVLLFGRQVYRFGLGWQSGFVWPLLLVLLIVAAAGAAFYFGEDIKIAGVLRETIKYLGFVVGVTICGLLFRVGTLPPPPLSAMIILGATSLLLWFLQRVYFLPPDKTYLAVNSYSNACLGLSVLALFLVRDRMTRSVLMGIAFYQACVFVGCVLVKSNAMSVAAGLIFLVTIAKALALGWGEKYLARATYALALCLAGGFVYVLFNPHLLEVFLSESFRQGAVIRLGLWIESGKLIFANFPFGIGPGQFGELGLREFEMWVNLNSEVLKWLGLEPLWMIGGILPMRFVHNTFLAMFVEWGAVAIPFLILFGAVIWQVLKSGPFAASLCFLLYVLPTLMLHDGLGFRANYLILGLGVMVFFQSRTNARYGA